MKIHDSFQKKKVTFEGKDGEPFKDLKEVKMYVCGVTPYDYAHIGNARPAIVFDTLYRFLKAQGKKVTYVRNFTDVDDKIIARANEGDGDWKALTKKFVDIYHADMAKLNVLGSAEENDKNSSHIIEPLVTDHIKEIITMIKTLLEKGHAYVGKSGDVLYNTSTFTDYGKLSGNTLEALDMGQRVAVSSDKNHETDFVLWKSAKENEPMQWDFDFTDKDGQSVNAGRPGWHIECSAMSKHYLGETFDIHGGGEDLKFPHHECEIAQSKGSHGGEFARYWMHNAFITADGVKMSKSLGNFQTIHSVLEKYSGEAVRLWMLSTHYRKPVDLTEGALDRAEIRFKGFYRKLGDIYGFTLIGITPAEAENLDDKVEAIYNEFTSYMSNDLNTPAAISSLDKIFTLFNKFKIDSPLLKNRAVEMMNILGLINSKLKNEIDSEGQISLVGLIHLDEFMHDVVDGSAIDTLVKKRDEAKASKDWELSDSIRDELKDMGIILEDSANGTTWRKA